MSKFLLLTLLSTLSMVSTNCGKNKAEKPTLPPAVGLDGKPVQDDLPILGTWLSCFAVNDVFLSEPYSTRVEVTFSQSGRASRKVSSYTDLNCQTEFTENDKAAALAEFQQGLAEAGFPDLSEEGKQSYYHSFDNLVADGTYSATMPDEERIGTLDVQASVGGAIIRRYDSYKFDGDRLMITNSQECGENCENEPASSSENRNSNFSDAIVFDRVAQ